MSALSESRMLVICYRISGLVKWKKVQKIEKSSSGIGNLFSYFIIVNVLS